MVFNLDFPPTENVFINNARKQKHNNTPNIDNKISTYDKIVQLTSGANTNDKPIKQTPNTNTDTKKDSIYSLS